MSIRARFAAMLLERYQAAGIDASNIWGGESANCLIEELRFADGGSSYGASAEDLGWHQTRKINGVMLALLPAERSDYLLPAQLLNSLSTDELVALPEQEHDYLLRAKLVSVSDTSYLGVGQSSLRFELRGGIYRRLDAPDGLESLAFNPPQPVASDDAASEEASA